MAELLVQVQPGRIAAFRENVLEQLCTSPAFAALVRDANIASGQDEGRYINVHFTTDNPKEFWPALRQELVRLGLQAGCIVTCTGADGWNDYLLLHHYDPAQAREPISAL